MEGTERGGVKGREERGGGVCLTTVKDLPPPLVQ